jgi:hypothetical protein
MQKSALSVDPDKSPEQNRLRAFKRHGDRVDQLHASIVAP